MQVDDPIAGVSFRNTKRHLRMKSKKDPTVSISVPVKDAQDHIHPRINRKPACGCGYPRTSCKFLSDNSRNYCFLQGHDNA